MKAHVQKLPLSENSSFIADTFITPYFETPWHYHSEYELVLIIKGTGKRLVGNHISDYSEGNLTFIGPNLPHIFRKDQPEEEGGAAVIHFREDFLGRDFPAIPEMHKIAQLFKRSHMGLHFYGDTAAQAAIQMTALLEITGMERLIALFRLLTLLSTSDEYQLLSAAAAKGVNERDSDRLNSVFDYVMTNFKKEIKMEEAAEAAHMSYSGFCRYFKNRTKKNFSHFVNEIRIGYCCRLLMEKDTTVTTACYESGFNNLANFHEQFRKFVKLTPHQFQRQNT